MFPFVSTDARLGVALADRVAHGVDAPVIPPELALALVPPYAVQEGRFLSPLSFLGASGTNSRHAARLLQGALGVEVVVTGGVRLSGAGLELTLHVAREGGARTFLFTAPESAPGRLARSARAALRVTTGLPQRATPVQIDLSSAYGDFVQGLTLIGQGQAAEAAPLLARAASSGDAEPRWARRSRALQAALSGAAPSPPLLRAAVALGRQPLEPGSAARAFAEAERLHGGLPLARLWRALLAVQGGEAEDEDAADSVTALLEPLSRGWDRYPFGAVQVALYEVVRDAAGQGAGGEGAGEQDSEQVGEQVEGRPSASFAVLSGLSATEAPAALLGGVLLAQAVSDPGLETTLATRLSRRLPSFAYAFERLSQLAFDADDPLAAAQALRTATRLEPVGPQSDLYWTNLGWAYYLLGALGESEAASVRALELNSGETVAWYNLGLVQVVSGRLEEALFSYAEGTARDLSAAGAVEAAAIPDLEDALARYPDEASVDYALATLLGATGEDEAAAAAFGRFLERATPRDAPFVTAARAQRAALLAPTPPLALSELTLGLGPEQLPLARYLPGDPLYLQTELSTSGAQLPPRVTLAVILRSPTGETRFEEVRTERFTLPPQSVAVAVDGLSLTLPEGLPAGRYDLVVRAREGGQEVETRTALEVAEGAAPLIRRLVGRGVTLRELTTGRPLYRPAEVTKAGEAADPGAADARLIGRLQEELARSATAAETLPDVRQGRFAGRTGAALFQESRPQDIRDFLSFLLLSEEQVDAPFAEVYARWALGGALRP